MCDTCGCNITDGNRHLLTPPKGRSSLGNSPAKILNNLLLHNDQQADLNRAKFDSKGVLTINLMSSPGSGKTALLEATIRQLNGSLKIAVIEGDLETENDADRIRALGVQAHQITTGTACHLDAHLVEKALDHINIDELDVLFIENVGNLVCPSAFDLGEAHKVVILSVTEGEDKPLKYPDMFAAADVMLLNKIDLLPYVDFDVAQCIDYARRINPRIKVLQVSAKTGEGLELWLQWLKASHAVALIG